MSTSSSPKNFLCISSYFKGVDFISACKEEGNRVFLVTLKKLEHEPWPSESIDEIFFMEGEIKGKWNMDDLIRGLAFLMRNQKIDRIVALDDFDVDKATMIREHFRIPGMGQTTGRFFRDKLAMRMKAHESNIPIPTFSPLFNDAEINHYLQEVPGPWMIKPRSEASATGIKKVQTAEEAWQVLNELGDVRHHYLIEKFAPGDVYHVDALSVGGNVIFSRVSQYLNTPMEVAHGGGVFQSHTVEFGSDDDEKLKILNVEVMKAFGMNYSASHTEFIKDKETGNFNFLETSSRVGGAHLAEMVEASSGINLWAEWARIESAMAQGVDYQMPEVSNDYAGIVVSLSKFQHPDTSSFIDPEIHWRLQKDHHIGMIVKSDSRERILELLGQYTERIFKEFHASAPAPDASRP